MKKDTVQRRFFLRSVMASFVGIPYLGKTAFDPEKPLSFKVQTDVATQKLDKHDCWFHPRIAAIPGKGKNVSPSVVMTIQKHLGISDYYSGLYYMQTDDLGKTWSGPTEIPELKMYKDQDGSDISVADVTPGWHAKTGKLLAIGIKVRYAKTGKQLLEVPLSHDCAYATFDPATKKWTPWKMLPPLPYPSDKFFLVNPGCVQWLVKADGTILLPIYFSGKGEKDSTVTVLHCKFDGENLSYISHGDELTTKGGRGFGEPSLAFYNNRYYLTIRNDFKAYVSTSTDAVHWSAPKPWTFDDGQDLGSFNTQAHWLVHRNGLFLSYTRRGANNDHIARNRAPIFLAQVDTEKLCVMRNTEKPLMPERGVMLGNFGAAPITENESWVTDAEYMIGEKPHPRGADGTVWVARVIWSKPNKITLPK